MRESRRQRSHDGSGPVAVFPVDVSAATEEDYRLACEVGAAITSSLRVEEVLTEVARRLALAVGVRETEVYEYDPAAGEVVASATWVPEMTAADYAWIGTRAKLDERPALVPVLREGRITEVYADDPAADPRERDLMLAWGEMANLNVPLRAGERVVGCITFIDKTPGRRFGDAERRRAALVAVPAAVALANARAFRAAEEQARRVESLLEASRGLVSTISYDEVLDLVCAAALAAVDADEAVIYEYDAARDAIVYRADRGVSRGEEDDPLGTAYPLDEYPSDRALLAGDRIVEERLSDPGLPPDVRQSMEQWGEKACLNIPLRYRGEPVGILVLTQVTSERGFSPADVELARGLGEQAAVAIRRAQLHRQREADSRRALALLEASRRLAEALDEADVAAALRRAVAELVEVPLRDVTATCAQPDDVVAAAVGSDARAIAAGGTVVVPGEGGGTLAVAPLLLDGAPYGVVRVRLPEGRELSPSARELLDVLAGQAAAAAASAGLYREVERQAVSDGLTGLLNHRAFYERLQQEFVRAQRYGLPLSLLMLDIDDFKQFNDRYGHPAGDAVLAEVGRVLAGQVRRDVDIAARYGGEEFAVILPNTPGPGAEALGRRLVRRLRAVTPADAARAPDLPPPQPDGAVKVGERIRSAVSGLRLPAAAAGARVTVSVGVAAYPGAGSTPEELVRNADKALYLAKRLGKDRVEVYVA